MTQAIVDILALAGVVALGLLLLFALLAVDSILDAMQGRPAGRFAQASRVLRRWWER